MGCWNQTCVVSNLPICDNDPVVVFLLEQRNQQNLTKSNFCYSNALYNPVPMIFYGKYNDYGTCDENTGLGLKLLLNVIKSKLVEFDVGSNTCHDIEVKRESFDIEKMWDADYEDRLFVEAHRTKTKLDMVMVHRHIFDKIVNQEFSTTIYPQGGNYYEHCYTLESLSNNEITKFVDRYHDEYHAIESKRVNGQLASGSYIIEFYRLDELFFGFNSDVDIQAFSQFSRTSNSSMLLDSDKKFIGNIIKQNTKENAVILLTEYVKSRMVMNFMESTRKVWTIQSGRGSQDTSSSDYRLLMSAMADIMDARDAEYEDDELLDE